MNTFVVANPNKCIACKACEIACAIAHLDCSLATAGSIDTPFSPRINLIRAEMATAPVQCRQCDDAPCAQVCPVSAIVHQKDKIFVKTELCIGCKSCVLACPFGAMDMVAKFKNDEEQLKMTPSVITKEVMVANKCDLCSGRPEGPACVEVCPGDALIVITPEVVDDSVEKKRQSTLRNLLETT